VKKVLFFLFLSFFGYRAAAEPFSIINRTSDLNPVDAIQGPILTAFNTLCDQMQTVVNDGFLSPTLRDNFMTGMAKSSASSTSALLFDRGYLPSKFSIGVGLQAGLSYESSPTVRNQANTLPEVGLSAQGVIRVGFPATTWKIQKFLFFDTKKLIFYLSGFAFSKTFSEIDFNIFNLALTMQYPLIGMKGTKFIGWNGILFGSGLGYATQTVGYTTQLVQSLNTTIGPSIATLTAQIPFRIGARTSNLYIPLEISTGINFLYIASFFAGFGADLNFGSSTLVGDSSGPVTTTLSPALPVSNLFSGTARVNFEDGSSRSLGVVNPRTFFGVQANLAQLKLSAEYHMMTGGVQHAAIFARLQI